MIAKKTRVLIVLAGLLAASSVPALAQRGRYYPEREGAFRFSVGVFQPEGDSAYWRDIEEDFTSSEPDDFENVVIGLDYLLPLSSRLSLAFSGGFYEGDTTGAYRDFEDDLGGRIVHDTTLGIASGTLGLMLHLTGPDAAIQPYVGAGGGAYAWRVEESGDFIDFRSPSLPIFSADLEADGVAFGYYGLVGLEAPISPRLSIFAEGRWTRADDELNGDLEPFGDIDLSGRTFAAGLSWNL